MNYSNRYFVDGDEFYSPCRANRIAIIKMKERRCDSMHMSMWRQGSQRIAQRAGKHVNPGEWLGYDVSDSNNRFSFKFNTLAAVCIIREFLMSE
ncbi:MULTISPECIES: hypothetical protein [Burkholderia]|uniref:Uncharacterized protein n=1 Tax=Burkholderia anthina TaxID=179879 RepID=A0A7T6VLI9_9BURK|nr:MULTISPECIES: hypothetical protein [Burkholderia]MBY4870521.1 hypothetical protein [Burkholderia anthina]QQK06110.1 hypothetical protein JFN94_19845 [Burkholderia anthina]